MTAEYQIMLRRKYLNHVPSYKTELWLVWLLILMFLAAACSPVLCSAYTSRGELNPHKPYKELRH